MRLGHGGSISGLFNRAQKLMETTAMAMPIRILALVMIFYCTVMLRGKNADKKKFYNNQYNKNLLQ